jgi:hypothetical protein
MNPKIEFLTKQKTFFMELLQSLSTVTGYNSLAEKQLINSVAEKIKTETTDYRAGMVKKSKKKDLLETCKLICDRTIENCSIILDNEIKKHNLAVAKELEYIQKQKTRENLLNIIYSQEKEFKDGFDSVSEAYRQWHAMIALIEYDTITTKEELIPYGFKL